MRVVFLILLCSLPLFPQSGIDPGNDELDDPDENQYLDQLLATLFHRIVLETADSTDLVMRGYSRQAISLILNWQKQEGRKGSRKWLGKQLHNEDLALMTQDLKNDSELAQIQLRQRIQYSPGSQGWRILNKGRLWNQRASLNVLIEQDPGESALTDHSIVTLNSNSIPYFENVMIGDFHVKWGGGLILNQQGSRLSLNPRSLSSRNLLSIRPHYSSRETDYYQGVAARFSRQAFQGAFFYSDREMQGLGSDLDFNEDVDGIHPTGKQFDTHRRKSMGVAFQTTISKMQVYGSALHNPGATPRQVHELGLTGTPNASQQVQIFTTSLSPGDQRLLLTWTYSSDPLILSAQYRRFRTESDANAGSFSTLLGSSAINEQGLSVRIQLRPVRRMQFRYALETGHAAVLQSYADYRNLRHHKLQFVRKYRQGSLQFDLSTKREQSVWEGDIWNGHSAYRNLSKGAVALQHKFSSEVNYRVNLKSAVMGRKNALVIQQRVAGTRGKWKWTLGYVRYVIPDYSLRLSIYETSVAESFSFFTCFDDGERWFFYVKQQIQQWYNLEVKVVQTHSFEKVSGAKQLALSFQMSVVL